MFPDWKYLQLIVSFSEAMPLGTRLDFIFIYLFLTSFLFAFSSNFLKFIGFFLMVYIM